MRFALFCATAALLAAPAMADELVANNGADSIRLKDTPCSSPEVLKNLEPRFHKILRDASADLQGKRFEACWIPDGDAAHLLYEDGDQGLVPLADFKAARSA